ncbi:hypothetical protein EDB19DRAFT_1910113 [Suillus lakei]|nr:hypothetical protein EDB19DRAFT_1910113 [Suillus lakei]
MQLYSRAQGYQRPVKQSKIASQRQYRVKEGDGFQELRDVICSVTGEVPQTRRETLKTAAELLRQLSKENGTISSDELESSSASLYEVDQGPHTAYEPLLVPNNETDIGNEDDAGISVAILRKRYTMRSVMRAIGIWFNQTLCNSRIGTTYRSFT